MSHELRTPLNAILGFSELITRDPGLTHDQRENLNIIGRSGEHLLALINDVLEISKIEAGQVELQLEDFDLRWLLLGLSEMFRLRAGQKGLALTLDIAPDVPQYIHADQGKLRQVLINLLGNAVKFTQQGGVTLRVQIANHKLQTTDDTVAICYLKFEIQDTGIGIAPDELDKVFEAFVQTESGRHSQQGAGLGLPISREHVRLMGGNLTARSEVGQGSCFEFAIPVEIVSAAQVEGIGRRVIGLAPGQPVYKLLVVEDEAANRQLLVKLLQPLAAPTGNQGFEVREATNGQEAIEVWQTWQPHLILMDMRLPVMDGHEATRRIKATSLGQETIIVALTASAFEEDRVAMLAEGCDDFVRKPFQEAAIFDKLTKHLGVRFVCEETSRQVSDIDKESEPPRISVQNLKAAIQTLPTELLTKLEDAARRIDMEAIDRLIDKIRAHNAAVADRLAVLAANFRYEEISALIQKAKEHKNE
jgi:CheY-like chemotaxis protein